MMNDGELRGQMKQIALPNYVLLSDGASIARSR